MCDRCYSMIPVEAEYCEECGAHVSEDPNSKGSDVVVYDDLAKSNLLRIRGNYQEAIDICLKILHRFPNNATAHTLLGDIYAEQGDLKQAEQWYEMALDLKPESPTDRQKLEQIISRMAEREAATTAQKFGLPATRNRAMLYSVIVLAVVLVVGVSAYALGNRVRSESPRAIVVDEPVRIGGDEMPVPVAKPGSSAEVDAAVLRTLQAVGPAAMAVQQVQVDPRGPSVVLTALIERTDDPFLQAARLGVLGLDIQPKFAMTVVRLVRDGQIVFVGEVRRESLEQLRLQEPELKAENLVDATARLLLTSAWQATENPTNEGA